MNVGFHEETLDASKEFREKLENLSGKVDLAIIRLYILTGKKDPTVPDSIYGEAEEIFKLRSEALKGEMKHARAQAKIAGVLDKVPEDVLNGTSLEIGFKKETLELMPSLAAYEFFMPYTEEELNKWLQNGKENNTSKEFTKSDKSDEQR